MPESVSSANSSWQFAWLLISLKVDPVGDLVAVALKAYRGKAHEEVYELATTLPSISFDKGKRHPEVRERHDGLYAISLAAVKQVVVECKALLIGNSIVSCRKDSRPCNRCAETLEAHLGKELDVLTVAMIEIYTIVVGIALPFQDRASKAYAHPLPSLHP